ncbi:hypothetical protein NESM_000438600 [Novymonas esmeraldas]|uniref:Uncharacterized protein n=1 Tax=Novymonas esmeraldas TaxID=1808958 RepID=A0AAW0ENA1_9TRYP
MLRRSARALLHPPSAVGSRSRLPAIGLQVLFPDPAPSAITADALTARLRQLDRALQTATLRVPSVGDGDGLTGIAVWSSSESTAAAPRAVEHRVDVVVRHRCPLPPRIAEACITCSLNTPPVKARMAAAQSAAYLSYRGTDGVAPLEQYVAVAAVAAALCDVGEACGVLNVHALTAASTSLFSQRVMESAGGTDGGGAAATAASSLDFLRQLPLTVLYTGFRPFQTHDGQDGRQGHGFRTHGAELLGLPNLAAFTTDTASHEAAFHAVHWMWEVMRRRGRPLVAGESVQLTADGAVRVAVRNPRPEEESLQHPPQGVLVLEPAGGWEALQVLTRAGPA